LTISMCVLPIVSTDYKMIALFIPIYLFINNNEQDKKWVIYSSLFALLLIPKNYRLLYNVYDGVFIDPILMVSIMGIIIAEGLKNTNIISIFKSSIAEHIKAIKAGGST